MSMSDRDGFIWYDGKLVPWREATTHVLTHSLHYGLAVFEGLRAYATEAALGGGRRRGRLPAPARRGPQGLERLTFAGACSVFKKSAGNSVQIGNSRAAVRGNETSSLRQGRGATASRASGEGEA